MKRIMENWRGFLNEEELHFNSKEINEAIIKSGFFTEEELLSESIEFANLLSNVIARVKGYLVDLQAILGLVPDDASSGVLQADLKKLTQLGLMKLKGKPLLFVLKGFELVVQLANVKKEGAKLRFRNVLNALKKCGVRGSKYFCRDIASLKKLVKDNMGKSLGQLAQEGEEAEEAEAAEDPTAMRLVATGSRVTGADIVRMVQGIAKDVKEAFDVIMGFAKLAKAADDPAGFAQDLAQDMAGNSLQLTPVGG